MWDCNGLVVEDGCYGNQDKLTGEKTKKPKNGKGRFSP